MSRTTVTIRDVARRANLSVASVSRALNGHANVNPDTRDRVLSAAQTLGYVPNAAARSLSTSRSHALGVVLPDLHGEFFSELMRGMDKAASDRGYLLLLSNMHADAALANQALGAMRGRVDGLIVMAPEMDHGQLTNALPSGIASVLVNSPDLAGIPGFRIDNRSGIEAVVRHLIDDGRKAILHLSGPADNLDAAERRAAFASAMHTHAPELLAAVAEGDFSELMGESLTAAWLAKGKGLDAIIAANDMMALGALRAVRGAGLRVPEDVAIAGFDDIPLARYLELTTLRVDVAGIGRRAVERLIAAIDGESAMSGVELMTPQLMLRRTTR